MAEPRLVLLEPVRADGLPAAVHLDAADVDALPAEAIGQAQRVHHLQRRGVDHRGAVPLEGGRVAIDEVGGDGAAGQLAGEEEARRTGPDDEDRDVLDVLDVIVDGNAWSVVAGRRGRRR